jgi:hypothetical protein
MLQSVIFVVDVQILVFYASDDDFFLGMHLMMIYYIYLMNYAQNVFETVKVMSNYYIL